MAKQHFGRRIRCLWLSAAGAAKEFRRRRGSHLGWVPFQKLWRIGATEHLYCFTSNAQGPEGAASPLQLFAQFTNHCWTWWVQFQRWPDHGDHVHHVLNSEKARSTAQEWTHKTAKRRCGLCTISANTQNRTKQSNRRLRNQRNGQHQRHRFIQPEVYQGPNQLLCQKG